MMRRKITHTRKRDGRVVAVGNLPEWWSPRGVSDVGVDIEAQQHTYWAVAPDRRLVRIEAVAEAPVSRLRAVDSDGTDVLERLPDC
ncbi:MAG: hypothetical protein U9R51_04325 [Actinomycetota bacterium]|nr:hypothetical protein [Actinomycetota bacterium]